MILKNVSVSQVEEFEMCPRKWYLHKIVKAPMPDSIDAELGIQKHAETEDYFRNGTLPVSECVKKAIKLLPPRHESHLIEYKFEMPTYDKGPPWLGVIDLVDRRDSNRWTIIDHKTTGNLRWAKTPAELMNNFQLLTYGHAVSKIKGFPKEVFGTHCYMQFPKGKYKNPHEAMLIPAVELTKNKIRDRWLKSLQEVRFMMTVAEIEPEVADVDPNWNACKAFGGCPYQSICAQTQTKEKEEMSSFLDKIKQNTNGANGHALAPPVQTEAKGVVPPDAPPPQLSTDAPVEAAPEVTEKPKARRGRPPKVQTPALVGDGITNDAPAAQEAQGVVVFKEAATGFNIYIDCIPVKGQHAKNIVMYEEWVAPIMKQVAEEHMIGDYRLLDFSKPKAELSIAIRKAAPPQGTLVISKMSAGADEALAILIPQADLVVRALKG